MQMYSSRRILFIFFWILIFCGITQKVNSKEIKKNINDVRVVLLVLDGCPAKKLYNLIDTGKLPHVKEYLDSTGTRFTKAITIFPSATTNAYQSMVSGLFPGHAGIPYLKWFNRKTLKEHNFLTLRGAPEINQSFRSYYRAEHNHSHNSIESEGTIFEDLQGYQTAALFTPFYRSASYRAPKIPLLVGWSAIFGRKEMVDVYAYRHLMKLFSKPIQEIPRFTLAALPGTDILGHKYGAEHYKVFRNLLQFDAFIGEFVPLLKKRGLYDNTYIITTSDHGMHNIEDIFDLEGLLASKGLVPLNSANRKTGNLYVGERGVSAATITIKGENGWENPISYKEMRNFRQTNGKRLDIISTLANAPEVEIVLARDKSNTTHILSGPINPKNPESAPLQEALIHFNPQTQRYSYEKVSGDPISLEKHPELHNLLNGKELSAKEWNEKLADTDTPGAIPQLAQIFSDGRAGDLIVVTKLPWGFYRRKVGTHGNHHLIDMHVPLIISGGKAPQKSRKHAQVTDIYPTMLKWFGLPIPHKLIDGTPLF